MSPNVYLYHKNKTLYTACVTHSPCKIAKEAGIYECLWRPREHGIIRAKQIIEPLSTGLALLIAQKERFEGFNPLNRDGSLETFIPWCEKYLQACRTYPDARVAAWR
jgi:hypothetical protein